MGRWWRSTGAPQMGHELAGPAGRRMRLSGSAGARARRAAVLHSPRTVQEKEKAEGRKSFRFHASQPNRASPLLKPRPGWKSNFTAPTATSGPTARWMRAMPLVAEAGAQLHGGDASGGQLLRGSLRLSVGLAAHHVQMDARGGYHGAGGLIGIADKKEKCGLQCHCYVDLLKNQESERTDKRCRFPCGSLICTTDIWYVTVW